MHDTTTNKVTQLFENPFLPTRKNTSANSSAYITIANNAGWIELSNVSGIRDAQWHRGEKKKRQSWWLMCDLLWLFETCRKDASPNGRVVRQDDCTRLKDDFGNKTLNRECVFTRINRLLDHNSVIVHLLLLYDEAKERKTVTYKLNMYNVLFLAQSLC